jgi:formylglycine-generating enzyme required for sulfatase activity
VYTFPHRTFQEYLAACHLTDHDYPDLVAELACADPNRWREVALLAGAKAARGTASAIWLLAEELCVCELDDVEKCKEEQLWGAHLAGQALVETADLDAISQRNRGKAERVRDWLVYILQENALPAIERAAAGVSLAYFGDPRPGVSLDEAGLPDIVWHQIPAGPFLMGSAEDDEQAIGREKPQHEQVISHGYQISRYPITNAQYHAFVQKGGYQHKRYWTEAGWNWRSNEEIVEPYDPGQPYNLPNHPVVVVSWYEAVAFCRWLTEQFRKRGQLDQDQAISLPTESQWEKAARGTDGRIYPWGNDPDPDRANYDDTGVGATSAVGCFPGGKSPYGVLDLSGYVREWTWSLKEKYPYKPGDGREKLESDGMRVLRGGSFNNTSRGVRCACRLVNDPNSRYYDFGFRVCVSSRNEQSE